ARRSLGTLNHTLLTLEVAQKRGLAVAGVVVNETSPPDTPAEATNVEELRRRMTVPLLTVVPHQADPFAAEQPALAAVDWWRLCQGRQRERRLNAARQLPLRARRQGHGGQPRVPRPAGPRPPLPGSGLGASAGVAPAPPRPGGHGVHPPPAGRARKHLHA